MGQINLEEDFPETPEAAFATDDGRVYIFGVRLILWHVYAVTDTLEYNIPTFLNIMQQQVLFFLLYKIIFVL